MYQILIVDDEPMAIKACQHALPWREFGMNPSWTVLNPLEGLELLKMQMIDACFVDIRMPELSGFEFIQEARKIQPELLFVVLTGYDQYEYVREAFQKEAFDYCLKPIQRSEAVSLLPRLEEELSQIRIKRDGISFDENREAIEALFNFRIDSSKRYYLMGVEVPDNHLNATKSSFERRSLLALWNSFHLMEGPQGFHLLIPEHVDDSGELQFEAIVNVIEHMKEKVPLSYRMLKDPINHQHLSLIWKTWIAYGKRHEEGDVFLSTKQFLDLQDDRIERALLEIHRNYPLDLSLRKIADHLDMNYTYFSELFSKATGQSFTQYLNSVRLSASKTLLLNTDLPISDISFQVGYNSEQYFSRLFKKQFDLSPSHYRKEAGSGEA